ncbi:MAG: hypothetical protein ABJQ72_00210 [Nitratireductor sp.]
MIRLLLTLASLLRPLLLLATLIFLHSLLLALPCALLRLLGILSRPALNLPGRAVLRLTALRSIAFRALLALTRIGSTSISLLLKLKRIAPLSNTSRREKPEAEHQHTGNRCNLSVSPHDIPAPPSYRRLAAPDPIQVFHSRPERRMNHLLICGTRRGGMPVEFSRGFPSNPALRRHAFSLEAE